MRTLLAVLLLCLVLSGCTFSRALCVATDSKNIEAKYKVPIGAEELNVYLISLIYLSTKSAQPPSVQQMFYNQTITDKKEVGDVKED